jgi:hypothetical protein
VTQTVTLLGESFNINNRSAFTGSLDVTLFVTPATGYVATHYRVTNGTSLPVEWTAWSSSTLSHSLPPGIGDGLRNVKLQLRYGALEGGVLTRSIKVDRTAPTSPGVTIAGNAPYTTATAVTLDLSASDGTGAGVTHYQVSSDGGEYSAWTAMTANPTITLASSEGTRSVAVRFQDAVGNVSAAFSDDILLDLAVPTVEVLIASGAAYTFGSSVPLTITATDGNGAGVVGYRVSSTGNFGGGWGTYSEGATPYYPLPAGEGNKTLYVQVKDATGKISASAQDSITVDSTRPTAGLLINPDGSNQSDPVSGSAHVTLQIDAQDLESSLKEYSVSNTQTPGAWRPVTGTTMSLAIAHQLSAGDGLKTVYLWVRNNTGNLTATSTTVAVKSPRIVAMIRGDLSQADTDAVDAMASRLPVRASDFHLPLVFNPEAPTYAQVTALTAGLASERLVPIWSAQYVPTVLSHPDNAGAEYLVYDPECFDELDQDPCSENNYDAGGVVIPSTVECYFPSGGLQPMTLQAFHHQYCQYTDTLEDLRAALDTWNSAHGTDVKLALTPLLPDIEDTARLAAAASLVDLFNLQIPHTLDDYEVVVGTAIGAIREVNASATILLQLIPRMTNQKVNTQAGTNSIISAWKTVRQLQPGPDGVWLYYYPITDAGLTLASLMAQFYDAVRRPAP